ncbi:MAG: GAF domain-containing sensor histidine kinase [Chloroflexi bacterium]|nr:GAF domain-containing sensor histidine kinase [Chloroflexota bacterium]
MFGLIGRLQKESEDQNRQLTALLEVGRAGASSLDVDDVLERSLDTILDLTSGDTGEIWLKESGGSLTMRCHRGLHTEAFLELTTVGPGEGIPGVVGESGQPLLIRDLASDSRFLRQQVVKAGFQSLYALPLHYRHVVGVLAVAAVSGEAFSESWELRLLEGIAERLAVALENARLHGEIKDVAVVQERERLAREMHDGMAQLLGYINTQTLAVKKLLSREEVTAALEELNRLEEVARDLYTDVREGILGLRTTFPAGDGIVPILREYIEQYRNLSGLDVTIEVPPEVDGLKLPAAKEVQLIRIVQEALSNVRRHANATLGRVAIRVDSGDLTVDIIDNGMGFDPARPGRRGSPRFGLQTMRERAESVGGTFEIEAGPGRGTSVTVRVPVSNGGGRP